MERGVISTHYRGQGEQTSCKRISASRAIPSLYPQPSLPSPLAPFLPSFFSFLWLEPSTSSIQPRRNKMVERERWRGWKGRECLLSRIFLLSFLFPSLLVPCLALFLAMKRERRSEFIFYPTPRTNLISRSEGKRHSLNKSYLFQTCLDAEYHCKWSTSTSTNAVSPSSLDCWPLIFPPPMDFLLLASVQKRNGGHKSSGSFYVLGYDLCHQFEKNRHEEKIKTHPQTRNALRNNDVIAGKGHFSKGKKKKDSFYSGIIVHF